MNDMNVEITRASATATLSMDTIRTRYGGSGAISFSDLYKSEGFTVTCGTQTSKFFSIDGFNIFASVGSVSPNESNGQIQFAANSFLNAMQAPNGADTGSNITIGPTNGGGDVGVTAGFRGDSVTRIVTANTSRTLGFSDENQRQFTYDMPASGTIHCLIKF
jgi:hypothetical protein